MKTGVKDLVRNVSIPEVFTAEQIFDSRCIADEELTAVLQSSLENIHAGQNLKKGARVAVTAGSRGITDIVSILREIIWYLKECGAQPFIVPAMGSHGGADALGQKKVLAGYGITEETMQCDILSSMDTVVIGMNEDQDPVYLDRYAAEADGIVLCNRVKPHTAFRGKYESGLMKMMAVGLGKQKGAESVHAKGFPLMSQTIEKNGRCVLKHANVLFGVAVVENAYEKTALLEAIPMEEIPYREPALLEYAKSLFPKILFSSCDVLVIDEIGKDYSGDGMDPNVTGTFCNSYVKGGIEKQHIAVLGLSEKSEGNAIGIGFASASTVDVFRRIDPSATYANALTCISPGGARFPIFAENDISAVKVCLKCCGGKGSDQRLIRIHDTAHLGKIQLSSSYFEEAVRRNDIRVLESPHPMRFDESGHILPM